FSVYPNPAGDYLTIRQNGVESGEMNVTFSDLHGRMISSIRINGEETQVETGLLEPGLYMLGITAGKRSIHTKIIKHR
ncbi:MAG: T9SS type A sorting domain-containing protein, partial [Bacteroidota bacterium]